MGVVADGGFRKGVLRRRAHLPVQETVPCALTPAWKLKLSIERVAKKFAANELWTVRNLPLPALEATNAMILRTNLNGVNLAIRISNTRSDSPFSEPGKNFRSSSRGASHRNHVPPDMQCNLVGVTSHDAEAPEGQPAREIGTEGGSEEIAGIFAVPISAWSLSVEAAIYPRLTAEFFVRPLMLTRTNGAAAAEIKFRRSHWRAGAGQAAPSGAKDWFGFVFYKDAAPLMVASETFKRLEDSPRA